MACIWCGCRPFYPISSARRKRLDPSALDEVWQRLGQAMFFGGKQTMLQLRNEARQCGLTGRTLMNKAQLEQALPQ